MPDGSPHCVTSLCRNGRPFQFAAGGSPCPCHTACLVTDSCVSRKCRPSHCAHPAPLESCRLSFRRPLSVDTCVCYGAGGGGVVSTVLILNRDFPKRLMKERRLICYAEQALHPPFWGPVDIAGNQLEFSTKALFFCACSSRVAGCTSSRLQLKVNAVKRD